MDEKKIKSLLNRYLEGACSAEEKLQVEAWLDQIDRRDNAWTSMGASGRRRYLKSLYQDIEALGMGSRHGSRTLLLVAASLAVLVAFAALLYTQVPAVRDAVNPVKYVTASTPVGGVRQVTLPDGSRIWLNAAASLRYPQEFRGGSREVFLQGEAFFDVAQDTKHPFVIHSGKIRTIVLGTRFDVQAYPSDDHVQVAVESGKVAVSVTDTARGGSGTVILTANQLGHYEKSTMKLTTETVKHPGDYSSWRTGMLVFEQSSMDQVLLALERAYDIRFVLANPAIASCRITGHFDVHQPVKDVIESICLSIGATYKIDKSRVTISGPGCS